MTTDVETEAQLARLDAALAGDQRNVELLFHRAALLSRLGRTDDARVAYLAVLAIEPGHFGALNDLGTLLYAGDFRSAARLAYVEAVKHHPNNPIGHINLGNALLAEGAIDAARAHFQTALRLAPSHPDAHQGLANLLQQSGEVGAAEQHRRASYGEREPLHAPFRGEGAPCRVLVLSSAAGGNVPTRFILPAEVFETWTIAVEAPPKTLPTVDLVFNAIGDADLAPEALAQAQTFLQVVDAPVVNAPGAVARTGRLANAARLAAIPDLIAPRMIEVARDDLGGAEELLGFPVLLRSPGYHTGQHFVKVETPADLEAAAAPLPGPALLMIQHLDARDAAGCWRKYRAMMIGGALFPLHLAISHDWKVHYFTAAMADRPDHRREEQAFLEDMAGVIGPRAMAALEAVRQVLGLDYGGVDFALDQEGRVLFFEANATMVVNPPPPDPIWDYRRAAVRRILDAAIALFLDRSRSFPSEPPLAG